MTRTVIVPNKNEFHTQNNEYQFFHVGWLPRVEGWQVSVEGWLLRMEGWLPRVKGWQMRVEGWQMRVEGWLLRMEGLLPRVEGWLLRIEGWLPRTTEPWLPITEEFSGCQGWRKNLSCQRRTNLGSRKRRNFNC